MDSLNKNIFNQLCSHDMFLYQFGLHISVIHQDFLHLMALEPNEIGKVIPSFTKNIFNSGNYFMTFQIVVKSI